MAEQEFVIAVLIDEVVAMIDREKKQPTATIWVTRDGQRVHVRDMTDSHLTNTIKMLRRNVQTAMMRDVVRLGAYLDNDPPDGAYAAALQAEDELLNMEPDDYLNETVLTFAAMLAEAEKRGLQLSHLAQGVEEGAMKATSTEERLIIEAVLKARDIQEFIWGKRSLAHQPYDPEAWRVVFQKRVDAITAIDPKNPSAIVELRKRLLQQAALSIKALMTIQGK